MSGGRERARENPRQKSNAGEAGGVTGIDVAQRKATGGRGLRAVDEKRKTARGGGERHGGGY